MWGSSSVPGTVTSVRHQLDVVSGHEQAARVLNMNDIGRVEIATDRTIPMDPYEQCRDTGGFLLVDRVTADMVAAGLSRHAMRRAFNLVPHDYEVDHQARSALMGHPSRVVWLTGLSGSGKSTIADAAVRKLHREWGHNPKKVLKEILKIAKAPQEVIDAAEHLKCDECIAIAKPKQTTKAGGPHPYICNHNV